MNMKKIMAAGIAATMAVTSLAAVASAETLTFNMAKTTGTFKFNFDKGSTYGATTFPVSSTTDDGNASVWVTPKYEDFTFVGDDGTVYTKFGATKPVVTVKGLKKIGGNAIEASASYEFGEKWVSKAEYDALVAGTAPANAKDKKEDLAVADQKEAKKVFKIDIAAATGYAGQFVAREWDEIREMKVTNQLTLSISNARNYEKAKTWDDSVKGNYVAVVETSASNTGVADAVKANVNGMNYYMGLSTKETSDKYAFMRMTTDDENDTIRRENVRLLSQAAALNAGNIWNAGEGFETDEDQSYLDNGMGDTPVQFAGLASQVADFFNHQTNGTITFKFTAGTVVSGWANGGIPSTQIGIKNKLDANNFALYVNYMSSTGSLQAATSVNKTEGTVTFDISEILADLGGQTKGVVNDLYYGLNQGIPYGDPYNDIGLLVEEVTLAYEEAAEEEDIPDEEEVTEEEEAEEEEAEEEEVAEEEEEEEVAEEEEEEEEEVAEEEEEEVDGDMVDEEPAAEDEAADENPGTGVALAVVPAIMAAAAVVVSKKRK